MIRLVVAGRERSEIASRVVAIGFAIALIATQGLYVKAGKEPSAPAALQTPSVTESCLGPDSYDPAAGCHPEESLHPSGGSLSGDDAYDPAAHTAYDSASTVVSSTFSRCRGLSLDELIARLLRRIPGGYSGDDAYDPAAGGTPELALLPFCRHDPDR